MIDIDFKECNGHLVLEAGKRKTKYCAICGEDVPSDKSKLK